MYFDSEDYTSPVKINVSNNPQFSTVPSTAKNINVKVRRTDVSDIKNWYPFAPTESYSFFSIGDATQDTSNRSYSSILKMFYFFILIIL